MYELMRFSVSSISITTLLTLVLHLHSSLPAAALSQCRTTCNNIPISYPFGIDDGCGSPSYRNMLNCSAGDLFFLAPSGSYKLQSIDYTRQTLTIYDPAMSTCSILQPRRDFILSDIQSVMMPPSPDTIFALLNCSIDSPLLNHYKSLCFNFSGHSCDDLYGGCTSFSLFHMPLNSSTTLPPCCFTGYDTVKYMSMNILDCTHYTTVYNTDNLKGVAPVDWIYGIKLSYSLPDTGCQRCGKSGGTCGFDVQTQGMLCICSANSNATRECASGSLAETTGESPTLFALWQASYTLVAGAVLHMLL